MCLSNLKSKLMGHCWSDFSYFCVKRPLLSSRCVGWVKSIFRCAYASWKLDRSVGCERELLLTLEIKLLRLIWNFILIAIIKIYCLVDSCIKRRSFFRVLKYQLYLVTNLVRYSALWRGDHKFETSYLQTRQWPSIGGFANLRMIAKIIQTLHYSFK